MSCPLCGEICRCAPEVAPSPESTLPEGPTRVQAKFEPESKAERDVFPSATLIDPEAYDVSEQQFDVSLEAVEERPRFVVEEAREQVVEEIASLNEPAPVSEMEAAVSQTSSLTENLDADSWRNEVTARLSQYRSRRRTPEPRYPSLQLKFESTEPEWRVPVGEASAQPAVNRHAVAFQNSQPITVSEASAGAAAAPALAPIAPETTGKLLEFPRSTLGPPTRVDELADSIFDQPRILEVPEVAPPPPALGGILMGPTEGPEEEKRPGIEIPLQAARLWRRLLAGAVDGIFVAVAVVLFGYAFFRINGTLLPLREAALVAVSIAAFFWGGYQYLLLVYSGTTPGLALAKLEPCHFNGVRALRGLRRWRVLASLLSLGSLGLGYIWCFLDEDQLCWHDRITRTYLAPKLPRV